MPLLLFQHNRYFHAKRQISWFHLWFTLALLVCTHFCLDDVKTVFFWWRKYKNRSPVGARAAGVWKLPKGVHFQLCNVELIHSHILMLLGCLLDLYLMSDGHLYSEQRAAKPKSMSCFVHLLHSLSGVIFFLRTTSSDLSRLLTSLT